MRRVFILGLIAGLEVQGAVTQISTPTTAYVSSTTLLPIGDPLQSIVSSEADTALTISFLSGGQALSMDVNRVGDGWATWGASPNTEGSTPLVVRPDDPVVKDIVFKFSIPLNTFGAEFEPDDTSAAHTFTMTFLLHGSAIGTVQRSISGGGGASLLAGNAPVFDSVEVTSDIDFAAARFRYLPQVATNVSSNVSLTQTGFVRNRSTGVWSSTMTVTNTGGSPIAGPMEVAFTNLAAGVTMTNNTGTSNGTPYITLTAGTLAAGASVNVPIQFNNPSNGFITFTPVTYSGALP